MNLPIVQESELMKEFLQHQNDLGIVIGDRQNLDTYAAALSLYLVLQQAGKKVQIISKKQPTVEVSNLVGIDRVRENFIASNTSKLVISLPYNKGEVEKVLFTEFPTPENPTNINFHLTAATGRSITPFDQKDVKLIWEGGAPASIITVGVGSLDEISSIVESGSTKIVNIDNFANNSRFGDIVIVDESFSSLSEVVGKLVKDLALPLDLDAAQNILDGVLFATRNFTKPNTSPLAFEAVSNAMYIGAVRKNGIAEPTQPFASRQPQQVQDRGNQGYSGQQRQYISQQPQAKVNRDQRVQPLRQPGVSNNDFPAMHMQGQRVSQPQNQGQNDNRRVVNNPQRNQGSMQRPQQPFGQNRPQNRPSHFGQNRPQSNPTQQFGQNTQDIEELMRKINEENARKSGSNQQFGQNRPQNRPQSMAQQDNSFDQDIVEEQFDQSNTRSSIQDAQIVNEPKRSSLPVEDVIPEAPYIPPSPDEIPDDWLMPKVFKSSKNNN